MKKIITVIAILLACLFALTGCNSGNLAELQGKLDDLQTQLDEMNNSLAEMNDALRERDAAIEDLNEKIEDQNKRIEELEKELRTTYNVAGGFYEQEREDIVYFYQWGHHMTSYNDIYVFSDDENDIVEFVTTEACISGSYSPSTGYLMASEVTTKSGERVYWNNQSVTVENPDYIEVTIKRGEFIVGYAVIMVENYLGREQWFNAITLKAAMLPQLGGKYQAVTAEQIKAAMDEAKTAWEPQKSPIIFNEAGGFYEQEEKNLVWLHSWETMHSSGLDNIIYTVTDNENDEVRYVTTGTLYGYAPDGTWGLHEKTTNSGDPVFWMHYRGSYSFGETAYVEITVMRDGNIIAYAVVKVEDSEMGLIFYKARTLKSVMLPQIEGKYQPVTNEQVQAAIDDVIYQDRGELPVTEVVYNEAYGFYEQAEAGMVAFLDSSSIVLCCRSDNRSDYVEYVLTASKTAGEIVSKKEQSGVFAWFEGIDTVDGTIQTDYIEIIVTRGELIVGYAVVKVIIDTQTGDQYDATVLKEVVLPPIDGEYQAVKREQVQSAIDAVIDNDRL